MPGAFASAAHPRRHAALRIGAVAVLFALALLADGWAYEHLVWRDVYGSDLGRMLRVAGFVPLWAIAGLALVLHDWPRRTAASLRPALWRGSLLFGAAAAGGIVAEPLKLLLRRERPWAHDGEYVFRSWLERPFSSGGLALPSSHAMVAFSAAAMLSRLFPRAAPVWYALAAGCGVSRVLAGAHFLSDVVLAAAAGYVVTALIWRWAAPSYDKTRAGGDHLASQGASTLGTPSMEER